MMKRLKVIHVHVHALKSISLNVIYNVPKFLSKINTVQRVASAHQYYIFMLNAKLMKYSDVHVHVQHVIEHCAWAISVHTNIAHTVPSKLRRDPSKNHQLLYQSKYHLKTHNTLATMRIQ